MILPPRPIRKPAKARDTAHIAIAKRTATTLVVHDRDAHDDVVRVLREEGAPERVVFHCFSGGPELAHELEREGYVEAAA